MPYGKILRGDGAQHRDPAHPWRAGPVRLLSRPTPVLPPGGTIRAFDRPVILVDDMLHDGKRIRRLAPLLEQTHTRVDQVLVGYLTGMGRDLMEQLGYPVDSIYYLPNLRRWFVESTLHRRDRKCCTDTPGAGARWHPALCLPRALRGTGPCGLSLCHENARDTLALRLPVRPEPWLGEAVIPLRPRA